MPDNKALTEAASALVTALAALSRAEKAVSAALSLVQGRLPAPDYKASAAVRTTSVQVLSVIASASQPVTLQDIADGVVAIRRGEDEPRRNGGTRYQEMCRNAILRLIRQGVIRRVEPVSKEGRMRFERVASRETAHAS